jgi:predicted nuclease of predicted toxin-antitoxin system
MKLLLDENLPKRLKQDFPDQDVFTIREKGWNGLKNGELLKLMINEGFDALLTFDKNLQHQQNFTKYPITVFILSAPINSYIEMSKLSVIVHEHLKKSELRKGVIIISNSAGV